LGSRVAQIDELVEDPTNSSHFRRFSRHQRYVMLLLCLSIAGFKQV
jgi:hypothetical protein